MLRQPTLSLYEHDMHLAEIAIQEKADKRTVDEKSSLGEHRTLLVTLLTFRVLEFLAEWVNTKVGRGTVTKSSSQRRQGAGCC